jgi:hypothetical protein
MTLSRHAIRLLFFVSSLLGSAMAVAGTPPRSDRIDGVQVQVQRSAGQIAGDTVRRVLRSGDVAADQGEVRAMLDTLHGLDFFHLPARMTVRTSVVQREEGPAQTQVLRMADEPAVQVCVQRARPAYEKCVTFTASAGPAPLVQWADRVLAQAVVSR